MNKYYNQWFNVLTYSGDIYHAKCIDIEFETGFGPRLLMETKDGVKFWARRGDILERKAQIKHSL